MSLAALQRDFRAWLTVEAADAVARFGERAEPGLAVYLNNYRGQLMACLAESFAAVRAWLGDAAFDRAAATHIDRLPPHSWTLDAYALEFPETLDLLYPEDPEVGDLACLERNLGLAFVGRDADPLDLQALAHINWDSAILDLVPTFLLQPVTTNAAAIWTAINAAETPPAAAVLPELASIAVWRNGFAPAFRTLEPMEARAISMIMEGSPFAEICAEVAVEVGEEQGPSVAGNLLGRWLSDGILARIRD
jgi:hypothetical protein